MTHLKYADVLKLLGVKEMKGDEQQKGLVTSYTNDLVQEHGEEWVVANRARLLDEWEYLVNHML